ncbi:phage tail assembly protein [Sphingomonas sp. CARO-RG-8B-R24-01]|uniref:phage tail assembly protein n=1 Tax=Sphingomonas sp. CARO-RG-8B-R24-01 TaxID=2914831 RepID=UPI001F583C3E|nr:phage tail assembly protein [Sphingomonas sp. CARO-RG-8B-R24-01]
MSVKADQVENLDEELVIVFKKPIDGPGGPYSQITIREPTADEIELWDKLSGVEADKKAISVVAGIPPAVAGKIPARDFYRAARRIGAFLS